MQQNVTSWVCVSCLREAFPMVLVANKVDLVHLRKVTSEQGQEMAAKHNVSSEPFVEHLTLTYGFLTSSIMAIYLFIL